MGNKRDIIEGWSVEDYGGQWVRIWQDNRVPELFPLPIT